MAQCRSNAGNVYLHFLLDLWFEKKIKPACRGDANLVRFADDFVVSFQYREDVHRFERQVRQRFAEFGLELAEQEIRGMLFGKFVALIKAALWTGETGHFRVSGLQACLWRGSVGAYFALIRIPSAKSCRKFLARTREWIMHRRHWRRWEQQERLTRMLRGFYVASAADAR